MARENLLRQQARKRRRTRYLLEHIARNLNHECMTVIAANSSSYGTCPAERALEGIRDAGYGSVELCVAPASDIAGLLTNGEALPELLTKLGLELIAITADADIATEEGLAHALALAWAAADLRIPILNVAVGNGPAEELREPFRANMRTLLNSAATKTLVCVEPHGNLTATGRQTVEALGTDLGGATKLTYDTANVEYYGGTKAVDDLPQVVYEVAHVHLKDKRDGRGVWNFPPLGEGHVDLATVLAVLERAGYSGAFSIEVEFEGEPWPEPSEVDRALRSSLEHVRRLAPAMSRDTDSPPDM